MGIHVLDAINQSNMPNASANFARNAFADQYKQNLAIGSGIYF